MYNVENSNVDSDLAEELLWVFFYVLKNRFIILDNPESIYASIEFPFHDMF